MSWRSFTQFSRNSCVGLAELKRNQTYKITTQTDTKLTGTVASGYIDFFYISVDYTDYSTIETIEKLCIQIEAKNVKKVLLCTLPMDISF